MTATYRVWCLSWEDTEADGCDVVAVDLSREFRNSPPRGVVWSFGTLDAETAAEMYADYAHDNRGGNECTWPLVFRVRCPDGALQDFSVDRDFDPTFRAAPLRKAAEEDAP